MLQPEFLKGLFSHICLKNGKIQKGQRENHPTNFSFHCKEKREGQVHSSSCPDISRSSLHRAANTKSLHSGASQDILTTYAGPEDFRPDKENISTFPAKSLSLSVHGTERRTVLVCIHHAKPFDARCQHCWAAVGGQQCPHSCRGSLLSSGSPPAQDITAVGFSPTLLPTPFEWGLWSHAAWPQGGFCWAGSQVGQGSKSHLCCPPGQLLNGSSGLLQGLSCWVLAMLHHRAKQSSAPELSGIS